MRGRRAYFSDNWLCCSSPKQDQYVSSRGAWWPAKPGAEKVLWHTSSSFNRAVSNQSFRESEIPRIWKQADVPPVHNCTSIVDFNKDMTPISLTFMIVQSRGGVCYRPRTQTIDARVYGPKPVWFYTRFLHYVRTHLHATSHLADRQAL